MKTIGIVGTRRRDSLGDLYKVRDALKKVYEDGDHLVSGGCPAGGDRFAEVLARRKQIPITIHYARWRKLGRGAGFIRNSDIAVQADVLIACVAKDRKGGTEDTIRKFKKYHPDGRILLV